MEHKEKSMARQVTRAQLIKVANVVHMRKVASLVRERVALNRGGMAKLASDMHRKGFIDTCMRYGIEKEAADRIYKEAGGRLAALWSGFKGLGRLFGIGRKAVQTAAPKVFSKATKGAVEAGAGQKAQRLLRRVSAARPTLRDTGRINQTGRIISVQRIPVNQPNALRQLAQQRVNHIAQNTNWGGARPPAGPTRVPLSGAHAPGARTPAPQTPAPTPQTPAPTPQTPAPTPQTPAPTPQPPPADIPSAGGGGSGAQTVVNEAVDAAKKAKLKWRQRWGNWAQRHPAMAMTSIALPSVVATNAVNRIAATDEQDGRVSTMTPAERAMYDRRSSGYTLPGLGLDSAYFNGYA